jgi:hypothetical protein
MVRLVASSLNWLNFGLPIVYVMFVLHLFQTMWELALKPPQWLQSTRLVRSYLFPLPVMLSLHSPAFVLWKFRLLCRLNGYMSTTLRGWHNVVHNHSSRPLRLERLSVYSTPLIARIPAQSFGTPSKPFRELEVSDYLSVRLRLTLEFLSVDVEVYLYHLRTFCQAWVLQSKPFATSICNRRWYMNLIFLLLLLASRSSVSDDLDFLCNSLALTQLLV